MHLLEVEHCAHYVVVRAGTTYGMCIRSVTKGDEPRVVGGAVDEQQPTAWRVVASRSEEGVMGPV